jgi:hypothetical protein
MKSSVKLHFCRWDLLVAAVIAAAAALLAAGYWGAALAPASGSLTAVVSIDGQEQERVVLSALSEPEERVYTSNGYTLTVRFSQEDVCVETSDCPTQDCVHTGTITRAGQSIVCLPARVSIQLTGSSQSGGDVDVVIG